MCVCVCVCVCEGVSVRYETLCCCMYVCVGPSVAVDDDTVCFGSIECGSTAEAVIHLTNTSPASTVYQVPTLLPLTDTLFIFSTPKAPDSIRQCVPHQFV